MKGSDFVSNEYLWVNSAGTEHLLGVNVGSYRPRGRSDYHILYVTGGSCFVDFGEGETEVGEGNIIFYPPRVSQKYAFKAEIPSSYYYLHFSGSAAGELMKKFALDSPITFVGKHLSVESRLLELIDEFRLKRPFYEYSCAAHLLGVLSLLAEKASLASLASPVSRSDITEVRRYMHASIGKNITVSELAARCNLSESRFSHVFKEQMGISAVSYLSKIRIERAAELLESTDMSVCDVGLAVGFETQSYFCRFFKREVGVSPSEYRRRLTVL